MIAELSKFYSFVLGEIIFSISHVFYTFHRKGLLIEAGCTLYKKFGYKKVCFYIKRIENKSEIEKYWAKLLVPSYGYARVCVSFYTLLFITLYSLHVLENTVLLLYLSKYKNTRMNWMCFKHHIFKVNEM